MMEEQDLALELEELNTIQCIPLHILMEIFENLDLADRKNASLVCIYWCNMMYYFGQLRHSNIILNDQNFRYVSATNLLRNKIKVRSLQSDISASSRRNSWLQEVTEMEFIGSAQGTMTSASNVIKLLQNSRQLETLRFESGVLQDVTNGLNRLQLQNLKSLIIENFVNDQGSLGGIGSLLQGTFPSLQEFKLQFFRSSTQHSSPTKSQFMKLYPELYRFLGRHLGLKNLTLFKPIELKSMGQGRDLPLLPADAQTQLSRLNLSQLHLYTRAQYESGYSLDSALVEGATQLKEIVLAGFTNLPPFSQAIQRNASTLEAIVWLPGDQGEDGGAESNFDMATVAASTTLKTLNVCVSILLNLNRAPVSITKLQLSCSLDASQMVWIGNFLKNLECLEYNRNFVEPEFFAPMSLDSMRHLLSNLPSIQIIKAYCAEHEQAVTEWVHETSGIYLAEENGNVDTEIISLIVIPWIFQS